MNTSNESNVYGNEIILQITGTTINLALGVPINSWVMWLVLTGPAGAMASEFFTLNLSACEILSNLLLLITCIKDIRLLDGFAYGLLFAGRPLFQCCIGVERFLAVVHPVLFLKYKPLRYRVACSALTWLLIIGLSLLHMLLGSEEMSFYVHTGQNLLFVSVMLFCSLAVLRVLKQPAPGETGRERERDNSMKRRAFAIICLTLVSFLALSFVWCATFAIFASRGGKWVNEELMFASAICMLITVVVGFVQPLLYLCQKTGKLPCFKPIQGK